MENDAICIKRIDESLIDDCVSVYLEAFLQEPWNEKYEPESVEKYFRDFMSGNICFGLALCEDNNVIGVLLLFGNRKVHSSAVKKCIGYHHARGRISGPYWAGSFL